MESSEDERITEAWRESAPYWEKHRHHLTSMFAPLTTALLDSASIISGDRVLDVAGGPGEPALSIARHVGLAGSVVTTDIAEGMVGAACRRATSLENGRVLGAVCSAVALPFADGSFDRAVCRLGVMFFPDVDEAVREMSRVLRPGGRMAFVVWGARERNPFFVAASETMAQFVPSEPDQPDALGAWRYAEAGALSSVLHRAGLVDVTETLLRCRLELPIDFDTFWPMRVELSDTLRDKMSRLDESMAATATAAVRKATEPYFPHGTMDFPAEVHVVAGSTISH